CAATLLPSASSFAGASKSYPPPPSRRSWLAGRHLLLETGMAEEKVEQQWPGAIAMIVGDGIHRDPTTRKTFILGTYSAIGTTTFPCSYGPLWVYIALTDGRGETPLRMRLIDVDEERESVFEAETTVDFADPNQVIEIVFFNPQVVFPEPG